MLDQLGNYIGDDYGYETEEERRKRLEAEAAKTATPVVQTIKTNPVTGEQEMTIKGRPEDLSASNPRTPTVSGPVAPAATFNRMIQAESGGQQFAPNGQILTSPKGAQGMAQIMPATAANPGFGVKPATPEEIATPEGNRAFGERYFQGLLRHFGGDQAKAVAAYNAGPGRVQQNIQANQGQLNVAQLPQETQGYIPKVLGQVLNAVIPSANAAEVPQRTTTPTPVLAQPDLTVNTPGAVQNRDAYRSLPAAPVNPEAPAVAPAPAPAPAPMSAESWADKLNTARQSEEGLGMLAYSQDPNIPKYIKQEAASELYKFKQNEVIRQEQERKIREGLASNDFRQVDKTMKAGGDEGSWMRYLVFGLLGSDAAKAEREKLFPEYGSKIVPFTSPDGKTTGIMRVAVDGTPLSGRTSTGQTLTENQLIEYTSGGGRLGKGTSLSSEVYVDKLTGERYRSGFDNAGNTALVNIQGGGVYKGDPRNLTVQSIGTAIAKAEGTKAVELRYTGPIAYTKAGADFAGEFNAKFGTNIGYASQTPGAPLVDLNTGQQIVPNANGTITATQSGAAPVTGGAPSTTGGKSPAEIQGEFEANKKIREQQAKNANEARKIAPFIGDIKKLVDQSTGSGIGALVDSAGNFVGYSTEGAKAIAAIKPLANKILMSIERFEGPQSNIDVQSYKEAAGQLADPTVPAAQKQAAFNTIIDIMKRNAPDVDFSQYETAEDNSPAAKARRELEKRKK